MSTRRPRSQPSTRKKASPIFRTVWTATRRGRKKRGEREEKEEATDLNPLIAAGSAGS
jgi:hypothetical protein